MKQIVFNWKVCCSALLATLLVVIGCPAEGSGPAGGNSLTISGNCRIETATESGRQVTTYSLLEPTTDTAVRFKMITVPVGGGLNFFTGVNDDGDATVDTAYDIAENELTYALYKRVRDWATNSERGDASYDLNEGRAGSAGNDGGAGDGSADHPVTRISWYDSVKFANALSEYCELRPVYQNSAVVMRTGTTVPTARATANGFRIPTDNEWELAARYISDGNSDGDIKDSGEYYPGDFASGAINDHLNNPATYEVAWLFVNSNGGTNPVRQKTANALGLYDMSGNAWEWAFEINRLTNNGSTRGGNWKQGNEDMQIGNSSPIILSTTIDNDIGVRLVR